MNLNLKEQDLSEFFYSIAMIFPGENNCYELHLPGDKPGQFQVAQTPTGMGIDKILLDIPNMISQAGWDTYAVLHMGEKLVLMVKKPKSQIRIARG